MRPPGRRPGSRAIAAAEPTRRTLCTRCNGVLDVATEARSVNCHHCNSRVVTERLDVSEYVAVRVFATANRMRITKKAKIFAAVRADELVIEGFLHGSALALSTIELAKTAHVTGSVQAMTLSVALGATLVGDVRVGPESMAEILAAARRSTER